MITMITDDCNDHKAENSRRWIDVRNEFEEYLKCFGKRCWSWSIMLWMLTMYFLVLSLVHYGGALMQNNLKLIDRELNKLKKLS